MAKSKNAPALFEVIGKGTQQPGQSRPVRTPIDGAQDDRGAPPGNGVESRPEPVRAPASAAADASTIPLRIEGGALRVSLTSRQAAFVVFVLVAVIVILFAVGHKIGFKKGQNAGYASARDASEQEPPDLLDVARQQSPVRDDVFSDVGPSPIRPARERRPDRPAEKPAAGVPHAPVPGAWQKGLTYICVQEFKRDAREDALRAQKYMRQNGVETALIERTSGSGSCRLITRRGFDRDDPEQKKVADEYRRRTWEIGERYFRNGGRYRLEGYFVKLKRDSW